MPAETVAENAVNNLDDILGSEPEIKDEPDDSEEPDKVGEAIETKREGKKEEQEKEPEKKVLVPHGAFHEERERRKELQKKNAELEDKFSRLTERQEKILEMLAAKNQPQQEEQFVDPLAKMETKVNEVVNQLNKRSEQESQSAKEARETNELLQKYSASAMAFAQDKPDFSQAYNFVLEKQKVAFSKIYRDPAKVNQKLAEYERDLVTQAYANEENPAAVLYTIAEDYGYKPAAASQKKTVEDIDKGLKASKSLGSGGAKAGDKDDLESLSAADLAEMSQEEFDSFFKKIEKQAARKH